MKTNLNLTDPKSIKLRRKFFLMMGLALLAMGAWKYYRVAPAAAYPWAGGGAFLLISEFFIPPLALLVFRLWMGLAEVLGFINTYILLSLVYFGVMTPAGIYVRLSSKKSPHSPANCRKRRSSWQNITSSIAPDDYSKPY